MANRIVFSCKWSDKSEWQPLTPFNVFIVRVNGRDRRQITDHEYDPSQWETDDYANPSWSRNGEWIAVNRIRSQPGGSGLYLMRPDGSDLHQVTPSGFPDDGPIWSPDGQWITFTCPAENDYQDICYVRPDGSDLRRLTDGLQLYQKPAWSPDGKRLAYRSTTAYYVVDIDTNTQWPLVDISSRRNPSPPTWSPNGEWIAFSTMNPQ